MDVKHWVTRFSRWSITLAVLTHWGRDEMGAISQTTFSNAFSWMKMLRISIKISLKFVPKGPINNIPALVQMMAWRRSGDKPLSEPMMVGLLTHICVTRPQWVNTLWPRHAIWRHGTLSTLAHVMVCYLTAPNRYLNQCWLNYHQKGPVSFMKAIALEMLMKIITATHWKFAHLNSKSVPRDQGKMSW